MTIANISPIARLLFSGAIIFAVLAAVAGASSALFSDSATLENSTFSTGTVDLKIANVLASPGTYFDSVVGDFFDDLLPGDEVTFTFWLKNYSSAELEVDATLESFVGTLPHEDLLVGFECDLGEAGPAAPDGTPDVSIAPVALSDWVANTPFVPPFVLGPDDTTEDGTGTDEAECVMTAMVHEDSEAEDSTITFDAVFNGVQVAEEEEV